MSESRIPKRLHRVFRVELFSRGLEAGRLIVSIKCLSGLIERDLFVRVDTRSCLKKESSLRALHHLLVQCTLLRVFEDDDFSVTLRHICNTHLLLFCYKRIGLVLVGAVLNAEDALILKLLSFLDDRVGEVAWR